MKNQRIGKGAISKPFIALLLAAFYLGGCHSSENERTGTQQQRPNVILILADDMGYSDLGYFGSGIQTPALDRLASEGGLFTQFYNAGRCCPSRASIMTGLYSHQAGVGDMIKNLGHPSYQGYLNDQCMTLAEMLGGQGYLTMMSGKWHLGDAPEHWPEKRGFEKFYGIPEGGGVYYYPWGKKNRNLILNGKKLQPDSGYYVTTAFNEYAGKFVKEATNDERPFFLYLPHIAPHFPLQAPEEYVQKYLGKFSAGFEKYRNQRLSEIREKGILEANWKLSPQDSLVINWDSLTDGERKIYDRKMAVYAAQLEIMDEGIGELLATLESAQELENTLILFLSDNGGTAERTAHRYANLKGKVGTPDSYQTYGRSWANVSNTPFRYYKSYLYEGGISTPLIAYFPERFGKARTENTVGHIIDLVPTILSLTNTKYPQKRKGITLPKLEGRNLSLLLETTERADSTGSRMLFWEHEGDRAVRKDNWKLVSIYPENKWRLYDLATDRTELTDRFAEKPELAQELEMAYFKWTKNHGVYPWETIKKK